MEPTVDDLFRWKKSTTIGGRQIWMRTLSAADDSERIKAAMLASRKRRVTLISEGSLEREEMLSLYKDIPREELLNTLRFFYEEEAKGLVGMEVQPTMDPPKPKGPTLEEAMDADDEWDEHLADLVRRREEWIKEHVSTMMEIDSEKETEEIRKDCIAKQIAMFCTEAYLDRYNSESIFRSCHDDEELTKRTFSSAAGAAGVDSNLFAEFIREYNDLDRFAANAGTLKN